MIDVSASAEAAHMRMKAYESYDKIPNIKTRKKLYLRDGGSDMSTWSMVWQRELRSTSRE